MRKQTWFIRLAVIPAVAALAFSSVDGWAQGATPAPFNKVTVSPEVAKRTLMKAVINADAARAIVDACVEWQKAQPGNVVHRYFCALADGPDRRLSPDGWSAADWSGDRIDEGQDRAVRAIVVGRRRATIQRR